MGIFSFFKKLFSEPEEVAPTKEKIAFSEVEDFIKKKSDETKSKEKDIISIIKEKINSFSKELKEKINIVNAVNIESKKENDKIKSATNEGRKKYIEFLERFIENIENANQTSLETITESINTAFTRFNENSGKSYERATILIGKEMGSIRETLKNLSTELMAIFNENKVIITTSKRLSLIKAKVNEIKEIKEKSIKLDEEISNLTNKIIEKQKESKSLSEKIEAIKNSAEYIKNIAKEKEIHLQEEDIEKEILNLKQLIDFKALSNFFHIFEDKMAIVKAHRDDFLQEFKKDKSRILNLLNESKLNNENISNKLKQIEDKEHEIITKRNELKEDETLALSHELDKINREAQGFMNEIGWADKKKETLKASKDEAVNIIKEELLAMNVELEEKAE